MTIIWPIALALMLAACVPTQRTPVVVTETPACLEQLVPPSIKDIIPTQGAPGSEIRVVGSGGYIRDTCGAYNESSRKFQLYLDKELAGELVCYVNHCEGKLTLSNATPLGSHCFSAQKDKCEFEFQVAAP